MFWFVKIKEIIRQGVEVPEGQNDLRRMQLRELALLNGTLRENDGPRCSNCGASTHKSWQCPDKPNITNSVICSTCGGAGHIARDCRQKMTRDDLGSTPGGDRAKIDEEYMSLMAELGEGPPPPKNNGGNRDGFGRRNISLFDRTVSPRAIMGSDRPDGNTGLAPPGVIPAALPPPPWSNQPSVPMKQQPPSLMSMPPVPNVNQPPPWQMPTGTTSVPPPSLMQPPPPPPGSAPSMPWMQPQQGIPPWQQSSPGPVPPPNSHVAVLYYYLLKSQGQIKLKRMELMEASGKQKIQAGAQLGCVSGRSPSPEPIYSSDGKRLNTREYRTRKNLEEERHRLINQMMSINTDYKPPSDYKGKGSVKEGKVGRKDGQPLPGEDEPLHAYVTANNPESVKKAVDQIKEIIRQGVEVPEGQNDLRRMQLRELALLNGTLRENDGPRCSNCGASTHKSWQCPDKPNITNSVICSTCGGAGHIARDCRQKMTRDDLGSTPGGDRAKIDEEYMSLMAELGEGPPPPKNNGGNRDGFGRRNISLFDRTVSPRAIMGSDRPDGNTGLAPPGVIPAALPPPPWSNQPSVPMKQQPPSLMSMPPVPNVNQPPPWQMPTGTTSVPPPSLMQPPPPPPGSAPSMPWMQPQQGIPPWQQSSPGPVPPPNRSAPPPPPPGVYPWQQAYPPPPQPVQPPQQGMDMNALIPNLLTAPPPPPPS
ncbi:hypothetical protein B566_EDAN006669 [Ephemera danica]|nr:hypothetical protein B566_EDAN006669 [Ephemera danica]